MGERDGPDIDDLDARLPVAVAERAVIEAAKEEAERQRCCNQWSPLLAAVEALLAVEGE